MLNCEQSKMWGKINLCTPGQETAGKNSDNCTFVLSIVGPEHTIIRTKPVYSKHPTIDSCTLSKCGREFNEDFNIF